MQMSRDLLTRIWREAAFRRLTEPEVIEGWLPRETFFVRDGEQRPQGLPVVVMRHEETRTHWMSPPEFIFGEEKILELRQVWPVQVVTTRWETRCPY